MAENGARWPFSGREYNPARASGEAILAPFSVLCGESRIGENGTMRIGTSMDWERESCCEWPQTERVRYVKVCYMGTYTIERRHAKRRDGGSAWRWVWELRQTVGVSHPAYVLSDYATLHAAVKAAGV